MTRIVFTHGDIPRAAPLIAGCMTLFVSGCGHRASEIEGRLNPNPIQFYTVEASIRDAPGTFDRVAAEAVYEIENTSCTPINPISGTRNSPRKAVTLPINKAGDVYRVTVATDGVLDSDYYGRGICHWSLNLISVTAMKANRQFVTAITPVGTYAKAEVTTYFSTQSYENSSNPLSDTGLFDKSGFNDPDKTFHIDLVARKATQ